MRILFATALLFGLVAPLTADDTETALALAAAKRKRQKDDKKPAPAPAPKAKSCCDGDCKNCPCPNCDGPCKPKSKVRTEVWLLNDVPTVVELAEGKLPLIKGPAAKGAQPNLKPSAPACPSGNCPIPKALPFAPPSPFTGPCVGNK